MTAPDPANTPPHVMVIGGTGMLAGLCRTLADRGHPVSVLARRNRDLGPGVGCFACDYKDPDSLDAAMSEAIDELGPIAVLISWIHGTAPDAAEQAHRIASPERHLRILGSASAKRPAPGPSEAGCERITLGFALDGPASRWLTHDEICEGVLHAFDHPRPATIVGVVEPWERRPS
ncbi:MAG: hypothetical protein KDA31_14350 [Phycisphaerales bacterium]|nr:hypothetical protein [Phycisphaerales bacterium]MCB9835539.1 short-chain dehydrogenase [Phycisphaera sp.]